MYLYVSLFSLSLSCLLLFVDAVPFCVVFEKRISLYSRPFFLKKISHPRIRFFLSRRELWGESWRERFIHTKNTHTSHKKQNNVCFCRSRSKQRRRRWWSKGERREFLSLVESSRGEKRAVFWDFFLRNLPPFFFSLGSSDVFIIYERTTKRTEVSLFF